MRVSVLGSFVLPSYSTMTSYFRNLLVASFLLFNRGVFCLAGDRWTDSSGTKTLEADFVKLEGIQLTLKTSDGKEIVIPLHKLDNDSRLLARSLAISPRTRATTNFRAMESRFVAMQSEETSTVCSNNIKQIALAMHMYATANKSFPPAYTVSSNGDRHHSWRTLLLPYLGHSEIYKQIDLSKPWNHPVNAHLNTKDLSCFTCPAGVHKPGHTHYVVVNDKGGVFFGSKTTRMPEITDGTSNTLLLAEITSDTTVPWMSPQDIDFAEFSASVTVNGRHMYVALADGSVRNITAQPSVKDLRSFFTRSGGEVIDLKRILEGAASAVTAESSATAPSEGNTVPPTKPPVKGGPNGPYTTFRQFTDGISNTLLAGTVPASQSVPWTKPEDVRFDDSFPSKEKSFETGYVMVADGSIRHIQIQDGLDSAKFRALFTINGGEIDPFKNLYPEGHKFASPTAQAPQDYLRQTEGRMKMSNSLKKIALAFHNYHSAFKRLPPAVVYGPDGKPWHSWRVLLLPFLSEMSLYQAYDQSVPWDDPKNAAILKRIPEVYRDPLSNDPSDTRTRYLVISGPGTAFPVNASK